MCLCACPHLHLRLQVVFLSKNSLTTADGVQQFSQVRVLSLADNLLSHMADVTATLATGCPHLEALSLEGNPLESYPHYRCAGGGGGGHAGGWGSRWAGPRLRGCARFKGRRQCRGRV